MIYDEIFSVPLTSEDATATGWIGSSAARQDRTLSVLNCKVTFNCLQVLPSSSSSLAQEQALPSSHCPTIPEDKDHPIAAEALRGVEMKYLLVADAHSSGLPIGGLYPDCQKCTALVAMTSHSSEADQLVLGQLRRTCLLSPFSWFRQHVGMCKVFPSPSLSCWGVTVCRSRRTPQETLQ